ncbi:MAG TPA: hypothetical protein ACFYD3_05440 [Candidatus Hypogeohydataceae bacterium YC41]
MNIRTGLWPWLLQRLSGLFLSAGVLIHFLTLHGSGPPSYADVAYRLTSTGWVSFYSILLAALIYHGFNGLWAVSLDFNTSDTFKKGFKLSLYLIGICTFLVGLTILNSFKP